MRKEIGEKDNRRKLRKRRDTTSTRKRPSKRYGWVISRCCFSLVFKLVISNISSHYRLTLSIGIIELRYRLPI